MTIDGDIVMHLAILAALTRVEFNQVTPSHIILTDEAAAAAAVWRSATLITNRKLRGK